MEILFFCEGLDEASARAQPWKHVIEVSKRMMKLGNNVQIFSDYREDPDECSQFQGLTIRRIRRKGLILDVNDLLKNACIDDFDIINWHGSDTWSSFYLSRLGKLSSGNLVWTLHSGPISINDLRGLTIKELLQLHRYWNNILNAVLPSPIIRKWTDRAQIKRVIALSHRLAKHLRTTRAFAKNISVIPSGVDTKKFNPSGQECVREDLGLSREDHVVLYYGPWSSFRGVDTLVSAVPLIRKKIPSVKFVFLSRGSKMNTSLPKMLSGSSVLIKSSILSESKIVQYLDASDIVVLPFRFWPQVECPLTVLESMAMEKALVTTPAGAISEIVHSGRNGVLVPPGNPFRLVEEVVKLLQDRELRRHIGENAREHIERHFDWDLIVEKTMGVFEGAQKSD